MLHLIFTSNLANWTVQLVSFYYYFFVFLIYILKFIEIHGQFSFVVEIHGRCFIHLAIFFFVQL